MSENLKAVDQIISYIQTKSASPSSWSPETQASYGDFAATNPPELSFDFNVRRQDLIVDQVFTYVGFEYRNEFASIDRCERNFVYPVGVVIAEKLRSTGGSTPTGASVKASRADVESFLNLTEELETLLYQFSSSDFGVHSIESSFDNESLSRQYLKSMILVGLVP